MCRLEQGDRQIHGRVALPRAKRPPPPDIPWTWGWVDLGGKYGRFGENWHLLTLQEIEQGFRIPPTHNPVTILSYHIIV